jgi:hypothetical protein
MLFWKAVAVYCENHTEHKQTVPCRKQYVSAAEPNRLKLFFIGKQLQLLFIVRTIRNTDTVRTSQETRCVSSKKPNRLRLFEEAIAVYCENHTELRNLQVYCMGRK